MPNTIYYSDEEAAAKALKIGNFYIGTGDVSKAPTNTTSFFNGINPPNGGYTIYLNKSGGNGPSISRPSNDANLIGMTNEIADASYTTVNECFTFFAGQSDKMVMFNPINTIITDDLVTLFSAGTLPSYPRTGTTWYDLSVGDNDGAIENGPTFDSNGWFDFDGVDDKINISNSSTNNISDNFTFSILVKSDAWTSGNQEGLVQKGGISNYGAYLRGGGGTVSFYTSPTSYWAPGPNIGGDGKWYCLTFIYSYSGLGYKQIYVNGSYSSQLAVSVPINSNTSDIQIGFAGVGAPKYLNAEVADYKLYNKVLTQAEINQNYYQGAIVTNGLIRALDFSNLVSYHNDVPYNATGYDLTGNDTFDLFNAPTFTTNFGGGMICEETDEFIALDDVTATDYVSVECWYTKDSEGAGEDIVWNKESCWELNDNNGNLSWAVLASNQGWFWYDTGVDIAIGETAHFVLTYDGNYVRFYKNGVLESTYTYPSGGVLANQTSCYPKLNSRNCTRTTVQNPGDHTFYQFRIYNRAITDGEVQQNYNATVNKFN